MHAIFIFIIFLYSWRKGSFFTCTYLWFFWQTTHKEWMNHEKERKKVRITNCCFCTLSSTVHSTQLLILKVHIKNYRVDQSRWIETWHDKFTCNIPNHPTTLTSYYNSTTTSQLFCCRYTYKSNSNNNRNINANKKKVKCVPKHCVRI